MFENGMIDPSCDCTDGAGSRLTPLGALGGVIAHEIAQPVTAASQFLDASLKLIRERGEPGARVEDLIVRAAEQIDRIGDIVGRMQGFVRGVKLCRRSASLGKIISDSIASFPGPLMATVEFVVRIDPGADEAQVDPVLIRQVLVNLIRNACQAMEFWDVKRIEIGVTREESHILIRVADSGPGIARSKLDEIFNPLFSTRESGLGLGLTLCRTIVEAHGGTIWADQAETGGAMFSLRLPVGTPASIDSPQPN
jgi:two-component system sensor kinase FixL